MATAFSGLLLLVLLLVVGSFVALVVISLLMRRNPAPGSDQPGKCGACGYQVRGIGSLNCPECGADLREVGITTRETGGSLWLLPVVILMILLVMIVVCGGMFFVGIKV
jgi:hypothetical protein